MAAGIAKTPPSLVSIYLRAALGAVTKKWSLGAEVTQLTPAISQEPLLLYTIDPNHVDWFRQIIDSTPTTSTTTTTTTTKTTNNKDIVPVAYLQCVLNSMPMNLLTHSQFPLNIIGSVHESITLQSFKPLYLSRSNNGNEPTTTVVQAQCRILPDIERSDKGDWIVTIITDIFDANDNNNNNNNSIMTITNEYRILNPNRHKVKAVQDKSKSPPSANAPVDYFDDTIWEPLATWEFPVDTGRRYAALNGDINPIHMFPLTAKLFGYQSCIAHGMFSVCKLAAEPRFRVPTTTSPTTVTARFTRPTLLPNKSVMVFCSKETNDYVIGTQSKKDGQFKETVKGRISF